MTTLNTPQIPLNKIPSDPTLMDVLNLHKKNILQGLNCHAIATVQSFDSTKQTLTATVNYTKTYFELDTVTKQYVPTQVNYPLLVDCPVVILSGGTCALTFPISQGDECLILFNDRDMDNWFASGSTTGPVATARLHSFSDAIALVGLNSTPNVIQNYDTTRAVLSNGTTLVGVGESLIKIANEMTTLKTVLNGLIDAIDTYVSTGLVASGAGAGGTLSFAAGKAAFDAYKTTIAGLLE